MFKKEIFRKKLICYMVFAFGGAFHGIIDNFSARKKNKMVGDVYAMWKKKYFSQNIWVSNKLIPKL